MTCLFKEANAFFSYILFQKAAPRIFFFSFFFAESHCLISRLVFELSVCIAFHSCKNVPYADSVITAVQQKAISVKQFFIFPSNQHKQCGAAAKDHLPSLLRFSSVLMHSLSPPYLFSISAASSCLKILHSFQWVEKHTQTKTKPTFLRWDDSIPGHLLMKPPER